MWRSVANIFLQLAQRYLNLDGPGLRDSAAKQPLKASQGNVNDDGVAD